MNLNRVNARLESQHIRVQPNWLKDKCLHIQNQHRHITEQQLIDFLREEYLNADFRTGRIVPPAFPSNIEGVHQVTIFQQPAILQILDIIDVGVSAQHLLDATLRHNDPDRSRILAEEEKNEGKFPRSMLKFTLTDGIQETFAMEYRALNNVDIFLPLGSKILVNNVKVLRGVLLLESQRITVLGGQVDTLNQKSLVQRLRNRLNLEEEEEGKDGDPLKDGKSFSSKSPSAPSAQTTQNPNGALSKPSNASFKATANKSGINGVASNTDSMAQRYTSINSSENLDIDSDIEYQDHILDNLLEQESLLFDDIPPDFVDKPPPPLPPTTNQQLRAPTFASFGDGPSYARTKTPIIPADDIDDDDLDDFDSMEFFKLHGDIDNTPIVLDSPKKLTATSQSQASHVDLTQQSRPDHGLSEMAHGSSSAAPDVIDLCDDDSFLLDESVQDMLDVAERLTGLRDLERIRSAGTNTTYVKATVNKFGKFSFDGLSFSVVLTIKDTGNDTTEAILSNELVQRFLSRTPEEFRTLTVPERRTEFQKILIDFKAKLTNLTAIMKLQLSGSDKPIIIEILDTF
ncbi:hypothetical protein K493DRAFT_412172 [Basidiobolus meristosporus CBS 931.73]|uniref:RecQ-mediated genome instability protein 1 n=1 Tax=Basidiobolus meristosporus CBS 931.73 TaxID=1314790 RepID=A0A1Y1X4P1_9FUNG|nr:hypothetical protein K493DRAFT_412172 [Basidiobolus meristosporus CBS 931.73]|eukprot:ORX80284.1 hypothetical protein K493DRAFT_412172 [Basidiobolus meristosporus CBS 931.73]